MMIGYTEQAKALRLRECWRARLKVVWKRICNSAIDPG